MQWLNYNHLYYFWTVAREGSIAAASTKLLLTPPTICSQLRALEEQIGEKLFTRIGRNLSLTDAGRIALRYADQIFSLGGEFINVIRGGTEGPSLRLNVGAHDVLPKVLAYRLLEPVFELPQPVRIVCYEGTPSQLLPQLSVNDLDLVLSDSPMAPQVKVRAFSHLLGECGIAFVAAPEMARRLRRDFPNSLKGQPALLPAENTTMRRNLERWFSNVGVQPQIVAEFEDIELMRVFGQRGRGFFPVHDVIMDEVAKSYGVRPLGSLPDRSERFFAISLERRIKHPAVAVITGTARETMFS
ncbi:MAG: LysR family transcriptional regulator [Phycisphaerae bacterium]|jgi:LysR family transcriptional activator of nhaA